MKCFGNETATYTNPSEESDLSGVGDLVSGQVAERTHGYSKDAPLW
jgi:hypothetical protein